MRWTRRLASSLREGIPRWSSLCFTALRRFPLNLLKLIWWLISAAWAFDAERWYVCKLLGDTVEEIDGFLINKRVMVDRDVLEWDFHVRSLFRRYLGPDHLQKFARATRLGEAQASDASASAEAFNRAKRQIEVTIEAIQKRTGILTGGWVHGWAPRVIIQAFATAVIAGLVTLGFTAVNTWVQAGAVGTSGTTDPTSGTEREIVTDAGVAVEVVTPTAGPGPTTTPAVSIPDEPPVNIPHDPEEDDLAVRAEKRFSAGVEALEKGDFKTAAMQFQAAVEIELGFVRAYYNLGLAHEGLGTIEDRGTAVRNYTTAIDLWNSLGQDDDGLLFQAKLSRGLLLVNFGIEQEDICRGRRDLLDFLESGEPSPRNKEAVDDALAKADIVCVISAQEAETGS